MMPAPDPTTELTAVLSDLQAGKVLTIPGVTRDVARAIIDMLRARGIMVDEPYMARQARQKAEWRAQVAAEKAAALADAKPYSGAIKDCQAGVIDGDRAAVFHRCGSRARFVVIRPKDAWNAKGPTEPIAVCKVHAQDSGSYRFHGGRRARFHGGRGYALRDALVLSVHKEKP